MSVAQALQKLEGASINPLTRACLVPAEAVKALLHVNQAK